MRLIRICAWLLAGMVPAAWAADGLVAVQRAHPTKEISDWFEKLGKEKGMTLFARIDHAAGAAKVGKSLRPTELLIFGNPQGGTPLMECAQTAGIDLPMKVMAWQDAAGQAWLGYNDPEWIARRHGAPACRAPGNLKKALPGLGHAAAPN